MWQSGSRYSAECNMGNLMDTFINTHISAIGGLQRNNQGPFKHEHRTWTSVDLKKYIKVQIIRWQNEEDKKLREVYL